MSQRPLLPFPDYQRVYQIIYSVLEASDIATTHKACIFFAAAGLTILREHYGLPATISAGCLALMVDEEKSNVVIYGRKEDGVFVNDEDAFHAWVGCNGWLIDFMAPIMGTSLNKDGCNWGIPRRMLQRDLRLRKSSLADIRHVGDFFLDHDAALTESLLDNQPVQFGDLIRVCLSWYRRPPKPLKDISFADSHGPAKKLILRAPTIKGVW